MIPAARRPRQFQFLGHLPFWAGTELAILLRPAWRTRHGSGIAANPENQNRLMAKPNPSSHMNGSFWKFIRDSILLLSLATIPCRPDGGIVTRVTSPPPTLISLTANGESTFPLLSADGRWLAFMSGANNLVTNASTDGALDIFIRDLRAGSTALISVNRSSNSGGNGHSLLGGLSDDGRFVAFSSEASDLLDNDTNGVSDVFVRDLATGKTILVSVNLAGTRSANAASVNPVLTPDGRFVVFESAASDLTSNDTNLLTDVFLRDLQKGITTLISVEPSGVQDGNGGSTSPVLTPDGRFVAFVRRKTNTTGAGLVPVDDVYARDVAGERTIWVSAGAVGLRRLLTDSTNVTVSSYNPILSADGRFAFFKSATRATDRALILRYDMQTGTTLIVSSNAVGNIAGISDHSGPVISSDGRLVAFESRTNAPSRRIILIWEAATGTTRTASVNNNGEVPRVGNSEAPLLSADGRSLAFLSDATDLVTNVVTGTYQPYARDLIAQTTRLISANRAGVVTDSSDVRSVAISADGRLVAFESLATDLAANDDNQATDVFIRDLTTESLNLVSERHAALPAVVANGPTLLGSNSIDAGGRYVLFTSNASNLLANDINELPDLFVHDALTGRNLLVTATADGGTTANAAAHDAVLSQNGRFVAFASAADNLVANDPNGADDVFLRDLVAGITIWVSKSSDGKSSGNGASTLPSISADGRYVAFQSGAKNLVARLVDTNSIRNQVFVFDAFAGTNRLVSVAYANPARPDDLALVTRGEDQASLRESFDARISPDGRFVLYQERTANSVNQFGLNQRWLLRDLANQTTQVVPTSPVVFKGPALAQFSADSRFIAGFFDQTNSFLYDLTKQVSEPLPGAVSLAALSFNGLWASFETSEVSLGGKRQITLLNRETNFRSIITQNYTRTGLANGNSTTPTIAADGRFVVFASQASDLVRGDDNGFTDVFLYDRILDQTLLVTRSRTGPGSGDRLSTKPVISANGRTVAFQSFAGDLVAGSYPSTGDIFVLQLVSKDSDGDGLDDDWEITHFGTLSRDGTGDLDGDGTSDLEEFKAGTSPTNNASIFKTFVLRSIGGQPPTILWNAVVGKTYVVQYKDDLTQANWSSIDGVISAKSTTASAMDTTSPARSERFYRVLQID